MNQFEKINHIVDEINDFPILLEEESENKVSTLKETLNNVGLAVYSLEYLVDNKVIFNNSDMLSEIGYVPKQYNLKENKIVLIDEDVNVYVATGNPKHFFEELKNNQYFKNLQKVRYDFSGIDENFGLDEITTKKAFEIGAMGLGLGKKQKDFLESLPKRINEEIKMEQNKQLTQSEIENLINDKDWGVRMAVAEQGYGLEQLINDESPSVRRAVARQGYGLDQLVEDKHEDVRVEVAKQGYGLDKLINDKDWSVRRAVARQEYGIEQLINDEDLGVRMAVAEQGYGLEQLINDESPSVRRAVAEQSYGLDKLINDKDWGVRSAVAEKGYGLDKLVNDEYWFVRQVVAEQGYGLDQLVNDKEEYVREAVAKKGYGLDKLINDEKGSVRRFVAEQGYGLDKLINDEAPSVRQAVAEQGYGLDKLVNDKESIVREAVAEQGYGLDKLVNDGNEYVRRAVAGQGYGLDKLVDDRSVYVRQAVAGQGYGLDKLVNDEYPSVRRAVAKQLLQPIENQDNELNLENNLKEITKYELAEYSEENGDTVKIYDSLEALKSDLPNYFGWISDNEPDKELPDFSDCETIQDINSVLKEWDYSYWNLEANKIEWNIDDERVWVDEVNQRTLSDKEYFEMLERESQELGVSVQSLLESEDQYKPVENQSNELNLENNLKEVVTNDLSYQVDVVRYYDPQAWQEKIEDLEMNGAGEFARFELDEDVEEFYDTHKNEIENKIDDMSKVLDLDKNSIVNNSDPDTLEYKRNSSVVAYNLTLNEVKKDIEKGSFKIPAMSQNNEEKLVELKNLKQQKMEME